MPPSRISLFHTSSPKLKQDGPFPSSRPFSSPSSYPSTSSSSSIYDKLPGPGGGKDGGMLSPNARRHRRAVRLGLFAFGLFLVGWWMVYSTFDDLKIGARIGRGAKGEGPRGVFDVVGEGEEGRDGGPVWLDPRPSWKPNAGEDRPDDEKYMSYLPHSGYNNQRISLQNAFLLSHHLNRTLLLPPVLLGPNPIPMYAEPKLLSILSSTLKELPELERICPKFLDEQKKESKGGGPAHGKRTAESRDWDGEVEREEDMGKRCEGWEKRSWASWGTMIDLDLIRSLGFEFLEIWDVSPAHLTSLLSLPHPSPSNQVSPSIKTFFSPHRYNAQFHLSSSLAPSTPPAKPFRQRTNIDSLRLENVDERVLYFGSLFGSRRLVLDGEGEEERERRKGLVRGMGFGMGKLKEAAEGLREVLDRDGQGFVGLHVRLEERIFAWDAARNSRQTFFTLLQFHLHLPSSLALSLDRSLYASSPLYRALLHAPPTPGFGLFWDGVGPTLPTLEEIAEDDRRRKDEGRDVMEDYPEVPELIPLPPDLDEEEISQHVPRWWWDPSSDPLISSPSSSADALLFQPPTPKPHHSSLPPLTCPQPLHTSPQLLPLNTPLYIATDTRSPSTHPALLPFLSHFPCTFFLSSLPLPPNPDDPTVRALSELKRLRNKRSGGSMWGLMSPFLDGLVAAGGRRVMGTAKSTFSAYVSEVEWRKRWGLEPLLK